MVGGSTDLPSKHFESIPVGSQGQIYEFGEAQGGGTLRISQNLKD